jgi:DNA polymerase III alpha subunit
LWQALDQSPTVEELPLFAGLSLTDSSPPALPALTPPEAVSADYRSAGLSLRRHPISFCRQRLDELGVTPAEKLMRLPHGSLVTVAGLVLNRQRPQTSQGITFVTLEDETAIANLIIRLRTWQRYELAARRAAALLVTGRLERKDRVVHVLATRLEDLASQVGVLVRVKSRDFH